SPRSERDVLPIRRSRIVVAEQCFPCRSPTLRPWIAARLSHARSVLRGGALEPELARRLENRTRKHTRNIQRKRRGLSLSGGASIRPRFSSSWASPLH